MDACHAEDNANLNSVFKSCRLVHQGSQCVLFTTLNSQNNHALTLLPSKIVIAYKIDDVTKVDAWLF